MNYKWFLLALLFLGFASPAFAQQEEEEEEDLSETSFKDRLYYSGGFDLRLGNITVIGLYPTVGYKIAGGFSAGLGVSYQYTYMRAGTYIIGGIPRTVSATGAQHVYGGKIFSRYKLPANIFLHTEYETLSVKVPYYDRTWYGNLLAGAGYSASMGGRTSLNIMLLYNLNRSSTNALYRSQFVPRVEFSSNF
jgi:hypothetical protein